MSSRDTHNTLSAQVRPSMSRRRSGLSRRALKSLVRRVIRDETDLDKLATSLGFAIGASLVVLAVWWLR